MTKKPENIIPKSLLRKPIIAILLTLLIGLVAYGFVGKAVETIIVWRETNRLEGYYRSIGYIKRDWEIEQSHSFSEAAELIGNSPYTNYGDLQRETSAVMVRYQNIDFYTGSHDAPGAMEEGEGVFNLDYWFYGKLLILDKVNAEKDGIEYFAGYRMIWEVEEVLAAYRDRIWEGKNYVMWIPARFTPNFDQMDSHLNELEEGHHYLIRVWHNPIGNYASVGNEIDVENEFDALNIKALDDADLWYLEVQEGERIDLSQPEFGKLRNEVDRLNQNLSSILLIGTSDMSAMPANQTDANNNYLFFGRWLNHDDEVNQRNVIVISKAFGVTRKVRVGSKLTVTMRSLRNPLYSYIRGDEDIENWKDYPAQTITYEVVGIYSNPAMDVNEKTNVISSIAFVPNSTFSDEYALAVTDAGISEKGFAYNFVLNNPRDQDQFIEEFRPKLKEMGFKLGFLDNNGRNFMAGADPLRKSTGIALSLLTVALSLATGLSVFLYLRQQGRNYAILRALGVPAKSGNRQLILPLLILGLVGSSIGSILSWVNGHARAAESLSRLPLPSGALPEPGLKAGWGIAFWVFSILVLLVLMYIGTRKVTDTPVLELLQNSEGIQRLKVMDPINVEVFKTSLSEVLPKLSDITVLRGRVDPKIAIKEFAEKHLIRSKAKSLLTTLVAAFLLLSLGWIQSLISSNENEIARLYASNPIRIDYFAGSQEGFVSLRNNIKRNVVDWTNDTGFSEKGNLTSIYKYQTNWYSEKNDQTYAIQYSIFAINNFEDGLLFGGNRIGYGFEFLPGFGEQNLIENWTAEDLKTKKVPLVVHQKDLEMEGWHVGDEVSLSLARAEKPITFLIIGSTAGSDWGNALAVSVDETIRTSYPMITNLSALEQHFTVPFDYAKAVFYTKPEVNYRLKEFKTLIEKKQTASSGFPKSVVIWDEEIKAVVEPMEQNLSLMEKLYPFSMLIAGLIGGALSLSLVLNQSKVTAMLRMLGVEKRKVRIMQVCQTLLLTVIGLGSGMLLLVAMKGLAVVRLSVLSAGLVYLGGTLLGSILGSVLVSNKKPMELLQVKE